MRNEDDHDHFDATPVRRRPLQCGRRGIITKGLVATADGIWAEQLDTSPEITYQHTVLCQTSLPYCNPGDGVRRWQRGQGAVRLEVEAGRAFHPRIGDYVDVGLPFGPKPRLVLAFLNSYALRHQTPEIDVGNSLTKFVKEIGLCLDGRSIRTVKEQLARLAAAEIRMAFAFPEERVRQVNTHIVGEFDLWFPKDERQRVLWPSTVVLDPLLPKPHGARRAARKGRARPARRFGHRLGHVRLAGATAAPHPL